MYDTEPENIFYCAYLRNGVWVTKTRTNLGIAYGMGVNEFMMLWRLEYELFLLGYNSGDYILWRLSKHKRF